jgi:hypothetical protein
MGTLPLAALDMDMVIGIIAVVGWIIAQALSKKQPAPPPPPVPGAGEHGHIPNPADDFKKFFENLEKGLSGQSAPPARPLPVPTPPRSRPHPHRPPKVPQTVPPGESLPARFQPRPEETSPWGLDEGAAPSAGLENAQRWNTPRHKWADGYSHPDTLRRMIVATEVLGTPLALRKPKPPAF